MKRLVPIMLSAVAAMFVATIAAAQPGFGFAHDATILGNGSPASPYGVDVGNLTLSKFVAGVQSPTAISGTVNDWNAVNTGTTFVRATSSATATITGITGGSNGRYLMIRNIGANAISYSHDTGSIAANRLSLCSGENWTDIGGRNDAIEFVYSSATSRWEQICRTTLPRVYVTGSATFAGTTTVSQLLGTVITPTIGGTVNDWAPAGLATATTIDITTSSNVDLSGITGGVAGRRLRLFNSGAHNVIVYHNAVSSAGNRFALTAFGTRNLVANGGCSIDLEYRGTFWYEVGFSCIDRINEGKVFANDEFRAMSTASFFGAANTFGDATTDSFSFVGNVTTGDTRGTWISPGAITGTQNDYNPANLATARNVYVALSGDATITGIQGGVDGRELTICNAGTTNKITFNNEAGGSTAGNRLRLPAASNGWILFGTSYWVANGSPECATFVYNASLTRWITKSFSSADMATLEVTGGLFAASTFQASGVATFVNDVTIQGTTTLVGNADTDKLNARATLAFGGADATINSCGTAPSVTGEASVMQLTVGSGTTSCVVNLGRTFTSAALCTFSAANAQAASDVASSGGNGDAPRISASTTTTYTMTFDANTESTPIYIVHCFDRF